jgi:hypothetical protein
MPGPGASGDDSFGWDVATGDFDGDGFSDLAIGAPGKTVSGQLYAGAVYVLYGSAAGLDVQRAQYVTEAKDGVKTDVVAYEGFGAALAAGNVTGGQPDDLAVGAPNEDFHRPNPVTRGGAVHVMQGGHRHLLVQTDRLLRFRGGHYGSSLAIGDLNGDHRKDLAVGAPRHEIANAHAHKHNAGAVHVIYQHHDRLTLADDLYVTEDSPGVPGPGAKSYDYFGSSLTIGRFDRGPAADLTIGEIGEAVDGHSDAGAVRVLYGSPEGPGASDADYFTEDSPGISGPGASGDAEFGQALASGDLNGDGLSDLAVGTPGKDVAAFSDGAVHVLYGAASGLSLEGSQFFSEAIPALADDGAHDGDRLGTGLDSGDFNGDGRDDLAVGEVQLGDDDLGCNNAGGGAVHVLTGAAHHLHAASSQFFTEDTPGMLGSGSEPCDAFGMALGG